MDEEEEIVSDGDMAPTSWVTRAYLDSVPVRKCADERRRAWVTLLYVKTMGFPESKKALESIDAMTRYLKGGFAGPVDTDK